MNNNYNNTAMYVREILLKHLKCETSELSDKYGISEKELEGLVISLFVRDTSKEIWKGGKTKFIKAFVGEVILLVEEMSVDWAELGFLLYLSAKFTNYEDNTLRDKDGKYINQTKLVKEICKSKKYKVSETTIKRKIKELEESNLLFIKDNPENKRSKIFYLSPHLFYKGKYIDKDMKVALLKFAKFVEKELIKRVKKGDINSLDINKLKNNNEQVVYDILECLSLAV